VNPGFPEIFEYQTMNKLVIGKDPNYEVSQTGFYLNLSKNDNDVFYKMVDPTKEFYIMFDFILKQKETAVTVVVNWVKIFNFYNDKDHNKNLGLCYRQYKDNIYEVGILTNSGELLGNTIEINRNENNTFELHVMRGVITNIEIYLNNRLVQTVIDTSMGNDFTNRINFYCNYVVDMDACLSHIIYNDAERIGNERIKMLRTDVTNRIVADGTSANFVITEILNNSMYKDITGLGIVTNVENTDTVRTKVSQFLGTDKIDEYYVDSNKTKYDLTYLKYDPQTHDLFNYNNITNRRIVMKTDRQED
jgi:hypothetical protein